MIVVLIGYMASGKSTLGKILADRLNFKFIDLDDFIESKERCSINDIFKQKGEIYFRKIETNYLKELLETDNKLILSLGGGTPCYGNNLELIQNSQGTKSIYLKASIPVLIERLEKEKAKRPIIAHIETKDLLTEFVAKHLFERSPFYEKAGATVTTNGKTEKDIIEELLLELY